MQQMHKSPPTISQLTPFPVTSHQHTPLCTTCRASFRCSQLLTVNSTAKLAHGFVGRGSNWPVINRMSRVLVRAWSRSASVRVPAATASFTWGLVGWWGVSVSVERGVECVNGDKGARASERVCVTALLRRSQATLTCLIAAPFLTPPPPRRAHTQHPHTSAHTSTQTYKQTHQVGPVAKHVHASFQRSSSRLCITPCTPMPPRERCHRVAVADNVAAKP